MRLGEGDGASGTVQSDSHAKVVGEVAQVLALEAVLQLLLHLRHVSLGVSEQDHVIHIHQNEEAARGGAKEETGVRMGGREAKGSQGGRQLRVPLPRCLLKTVDRSTQLPHSVFWKGGMEPGGSLEEDALVQVPLQERVGDVHGADLHVVARTNVEEGAEGGRLGGGGVGEPVIFSPSLGEPLSAIPGLVDRIFAWQLLHPKDPLALDKVGIGWEGDINEGCQNIIVLTFVPVPRPGPDPVPSPAPSPVPSPRPAPSLARTRPRRPLAPLSLLLLLQLLLLLLLLLLLQLLLLLLLSC
ncbi:unnamed protein product, partial [Closterium sp. NIES-54]